ncbi:MAG: type II secretion system F family protein [Candidatus Aenigmatarchaeota archaeon]
MDIKIYKFLPKSYLEYIKNSIEHTNLKIDEKSFVNFQIFFSFLIFTILIFLTKNILISIVSFFISFLFILLLLYLSVESSKKYVENVLPDALSLISSNVRSGLNLEEAMMVSARKEFGMLEKLFKKIAKECYAGIPIEESIRKNLKNVKIESVKRVFELILEGIEKGSRISDLLFDLSEDLRQRNALKKEISAVTSMYFIFIFFAVAIGAPLLYGIVVNFVNILIKVSPPELPNLPINVPLSFKGLKIDVSFIENYSYIALFITILFSSLILGAIKDGNEKVGLKYLPMLLIVSFSVFFASKYLVALIFSFFV